MMLNQDMEDWNTKQKKLTLEPLEDAKKKFGLPLSVLQRLQRETCFSLLKVLV